MYRAVAVLGLLFLPGLVIAHTRWFADGELPAAVTTEPAGWYLGLFSLAAAGVLAGAVTLHQRNYWRLAWLRPTTAHAYDRAAATFAMVSGTFFMIAGTHQYLFSPNLTIDAGIPFALMTVQLLIGLAFLLGIATRTAALMLALLWVSSFWYTSSVEALENIWVLSTAAFIAVMGNDYFSLVGVSFFKRRFARFKPYALSWLRLGTGFTLVVLGLSEKILAPELGLDFLATYHWNFMAALGLPYSDYLFVLSAGVVESLLGAILMVGALTRLTALVLTVIFLIPVFFLGPIELSGHLPHFAAIVLLLLFGNGGRYLVVRRYNDATWLR